jgi:hypothetical protein
MAATAAISGVISTPDTTLKQLFIDSATFKSRAEGEAKLIFNRDVRLKNRSNVRRRPHSGPRNQGGGYGNSGYGGNGGW